MYLICINYSRDGLFDLMVEDIEKTTAFSAGILFGIITSMVAISH